MPHWLDWPERLSPSIHLRQSAQAGCTLGFSAANQPREKKSTSTIEMPVDFGCYERHQ
jgi:hypothetical protein